jgi:CheY-like chemotaxis protein
MTPATILVADDDAAIRRLLGRALREEGYTVLSAATGGEALEQACLAPDLLIADLVMPPGGGLELAERLRALVPRLAVLHISGYAVRRDFNTDPAASLLSKPFSRQQLIEHVEWALGTRAPA